jgi:hypothetical protein
LQVFNGDKMAAPDLQREFTIRQVNRANREGDVALLISAALHQASDPNIRCHAIAAFFDHIDSPSHARLMKAATQIATTEKGEIVGRHAITFVEAAPVLRGHTKNEAFLRGALGNPRFARSVRGAAHCRLAKLIPESELPPDPDFESLRADLRADYANAKPSFSAGVKDMDESGQVRKHPARKGVDGWQEKLIIPKRVRRNET